jgi:hypothetical protein
MVAIADVDDDWDWEITVAELGGSRVATYDIDGTDRGSFSGVPSGAVITGLQARDFDDDSRDEIVVSSSNGTVFAYNRIGAFNFAVTVPVGATVHVVDVSQDEIPDILFSVPSGLSAVFASGDAVLLPTSLASLLAGGSIASW